MSKTAIMIVAVVVALAAAGGGYWYGMQKSGMGGGMTAATGAPGSGGPAKGAAAPGGPRGPGAGGGAPPVAVEAIKVATAPMPQTITAVGSLRSDESVTLRPEVAGRISAITFEEGQRVAKGAPLVKLDPAIQQAEVQQARANLTLAKSKFDRAVDLAKRNYISGQAKDEAENNLKVARGVARSSPRPSSPRPKSARRSPGSSACARCPSATT